uniref:Uncharacterized protein n=1 Tax=Arundo donax TaxID=35708 RepID=A0A0A9C332_ARUDO
MEQRTKTRTPVVSGN